MIPIRYDLLRASVKYNDFIGTAAADRADYPEAHGFEDLFMAAGLDLSTYLPIAYSFSIPEETYFPDRLKTPDCYLIAHCVLRSEAGDDIEKLSTDGETLPIHRFYLEVQPTDFLRLFKRLKITFVMGTAGAENARSGSYIEDIQDETPLPAGE